MKSGVVVDSRHHRHCHRPSVGDGGHGAAARGDAAYATGTVSPGNCHTLLPSLVVCVTWRGTAASTAATATTRGARMRAA